MSFRERFTWKEYYLIGGFIIIWVFAAFALVQALSDLDFATAGFAVIVGIVFSGILYALISIIDRFL